MMEDNAGHPVTLRELELSLGKLTRLHRLLYTHGPGGGTLLLLPLDQGLEHGPRDFFVNPQSADPAYQVRLALVGGFSGIVLHYGLAHKYLRDVAGKVPLVLKLNGKTEIPPDQAAFSPLISTVSDAVRLGADAVGYTLYVGSPAQDRDIDQFRQVRDEAEFYGMPVIVWAYPRGAAIDAHGGRDSVYAIDYAARVASELGADIIKLSFPKTSGIDLDKLPAPYNDMEFTPAGAIRQIIQSAGRSFVILSGGSRADDEDVMEKARLAMAAGARGMIFGRNMWQRTWENSLNLSARLHELLRGYLLPE
ncbi:MAG TPA: fructose-bisphosphate aldolase [Armatimonadota bacterium]|jgi:class I fructose-bisphosphate aldolase